jgi:hypothetical protein
MYGCRDSLPDVCQPCRSDRQGSVASQATQSAQPDRSRTDDQDSVRVRSIIESCPESETIGSPKPRDCNSEAFRAFRNPYGTP